MWGMDKAKSLMDSFLGTGTANAVENVLEDAETRESIDKEFESKIVAYVKSEYGKRQSHRSALELQWRWNINFYNGEQFTKIDSLKNDIEEVLPLNDWEERNVFNEIAPAIETRFAILSKRKNNLKNTPASSSSEDRTSAKLGNKVLASTRKRLCMSDLQQEANLISGVMSSAIWKTVWDPSAGRVVGREMRELTDDEMGNPTEYEYENDRLGYGKRIGVREIHEGDVVTTVHSPFEIYPENVSVPCRKQRRIMHVVLMSPDEVYEKWGVRVKGKENSSYKISASNTMSNGSAIMGRTGGHMFSCVTVYDSVKVYEEWELPTYRYPDGRLIICTDDKLLHYGTLPDRLSEDGSYKLPFDVQQSLKTDGFFGTSVVERMIPIQIKYNSVKNRMQDFINRVSIGNLVAEENSLVDEDYWLENGIAPGDVITYRRGANAPRFMTTDDLPADLYREEQQLLDAFDRLSGVSQLAKQSIVPSQVTSGVAIAGLAEQDDTRIGLEAENIKNCLISIGKKWLVLYHNNVDFPRMVKDLGKNNEFEVEQFRGSDLTSFDVFIESEPESSDTLSQRRQKVVELLNAGLFNDPETGNITPEGRIKVFEMLELGDWENFIDAEDDQKKRAQRENNAMVTGEMAELYDFDDDMMHISVHNNFRLKPEFEEARRRNPQLNAMFEEHVNKHLEALQSKSQTEQQIQEQQNIQLPVDMFAEQG